MSLLLVRPHISAAIELEAARESALGMAAHAELVSRPVQIVGAVVTMALVGLALGAVFAAAWAALRPHLPATTDFGRTQMLAAAGFVSVSLLPWLKYPPDLPGIGAEDTVVGRTWAYTTLIVAALLVAAALFLLDQTLRRRVTGLSRRWATLVAATVAGAVFLLAAWPADPDVVPPDLPALLLWDFRLASLAQLAVFWLGMGLTAGALLQRPEKPRSPLPDLSKNASGTRV